jgi:hypothetical protein
MGQDINAVNFNRLFKKAQESDEGGSLPGNGLHKIMECGHRNLYGPAPMKVFRTSSAGAPIIGHSTITP